ncbi:MAG TPA: DUF190 domain-containing protein [Planctomycetota bacterium]|jgi:CBS domain-containing protein
MLNYKLITVFTSENARYEGRPLYDAIQLYVRSLKSGVHCAVMRGIGACYESGEISTVKLEVMSLNLPIQVQIVLPAAEADAVLAKITEMTTEGIVAVQDLPVVSHKVKRALLPRQLRVRDVMTANPKSVAPAMSASEVARLLLSSKFHAFPVTNAEGKPIGIITQGDLIERAGMPVRLGLLEEFGHPGISTALSGLSKKTAEQIMSQPLVTVTEDKPVSEAVSVLLSNKLKRLPVVNAEGKLTGMLSRYDIFHAISKESPDWAAMQQRNVVVNDARTVKDVMQRDVHTVPPEMAVEDVLKGLGAHDVQRAAVVAPDGKLLGLVADRDLLAAFSDEKAGVWHYMVAVLTGRGEATIGEKIRKMPIEKVMKRGVITVREDAGIEIAIALMTQHHLKRLPVIDEHGAFKGMISRDALLRVAVAAI